MLRGGAENLLDAETRVGAGRDDAGFGAGIIDVDMGDARRSRLGDDHETTIDALSIKRGHVIPTKGIVTH